LAEELRQLRDLLLRAFTRQGVGRHEIRGGTPCLVVGETLAFFQQPAREVHGDDTTVLVMGAANDEPFNVPLVRHALNTRQRQRVLKASSPRLWNLMWPITGQATETLFFNNAANVLDQFLVNDNMIQPGTPITTDPESVTIEDGPFGISDPTATYPQPIRFDRLGKPVNRDGFSDRYPISIKVEEAD
jgi:hypothetical protein